MSTDVPAAIPAPASRKSLLAAIVALLAAVAVGVGLWLLLTAGAGQVAMIRVTKHSLLPESLAGTPDYYLTIGVPGNEQITTKTYSDTPIGNGLDFRLAKPFELEQITHIELIDEDLGGDDIRDRVDVRERICRGQDYQFELIGPESPRRTAAYVTLGTGGAVLLIAVILWVRSHAI